MAILAQRAKILDLANSVINIPSLQPEDWRLENPRFSQEAIAANVRLADCVAEVATPVQVALAWLRSRDVAAIPGTRRIERLEENCASQDITLGTEQLDRLESLIDDGVVGNRYRSTGSRLSLMVMKRRSIATYLGLTSRHLCLIYNLAFFSRR